MLCLSLSIIKEPARLKTRQCENRPTDTNQEVSISKSLLFSTKTNVLQPSYVYNHFALAYYLPKHVDITQGWHLVVFSKMCISPIIK